MLTKNTNGLLIGSSIGCLYNEEISTKEKCICINKKTLKKKIHGDGEID